MLGVARLYEAVWKAPQDRVAGRGRVPALLFRAMLGLSKQARQRFGLRLGRRLCGSLHQRLAPRLRMVVAGGAALDPALGRNLQALGWAVATGYGLSETAPILTYTPPERVRLDAAGVALPGVELAIDDGGSGDGRGEVMARGPNVFAGYLNLPDKTAKVLDADGWYRTGDTGEIDADGFLYLHGRESAMIVLSGGENIEPERVEGVLQSAEGVREAGVLQSAEGVREAGVLEHDDRLAVVAVPDAGLMSQATGEELERRTREAVNEAAKSLPTHHRPGAVRVALDPLPRTRLGKLRRHKLEELFEELGREDAVSRARPEPVSPESMAPEDQQLLSDPGAECIWNYLAERFHDRRLTPDTGLADELGVDSLSWVDLTLALQDRVGIDLDDTAIERVETVRDLLQEAAATVQRGHGLIWFPEGQRSPDGSLQPLRPGIGLVLAAQPVPVVPVWIEGTREVMAPGQRLPRPGGKVRIVIGDPVDPRTAGGDERAIVRDLQAALEELGQV